MEDIKYLLERFPLYGLENFLFISVGELVPTSERPHEDTQYELRIWTDQSLKLTRESNVFIRNDTSIYGSLEMLQRTHEALGQALNKIYLEQDIAKYPKKEESNES